MKAAQMMEDWLGQGLLVQSLGVALGLALAFRFFLFRRDADNVRDQELLAANIQREKDTARLAKLVHLFQQARGRPPQDTDELVVWSQSAGGRAAISLHLDKEGQIIP